MIDLPERPSFTPLEFNQPLPTRMDPHQAEMCAIIAAADIVATVVPLLGVTHRDSTVVIMTDSEVCVKALADIATIRSKKMKKLAKAASRVWTKLRKDKKIYGYGWYAIKRADNEAHGASRHARLTTQRTIECLKNQRRRDDAGPS